MEQIGSNPRLWLESEYLARKRKNSGYSLRAFARFLDIPSGRLSQLLSEKRRLTPKLGEKIASRLNFDPKQKEELLRSIRSAGAKKPTDSSGSVPYRALDMDQFQVIADPLHFSILSLLETDKFSGELRDIARRLGISAPEARSALGRLERIGLVRKGSGKYRLTAQEARTTSHDISSAALREAHKRVLGETTSLIDEVSVELRDITSMTMAIDPKKLPEAKERIRAFRRSLSEFLESGRRTEVYRINIQLVPVTKEGKK
jgi:uncharacterized protein (TIGR02147 family)